MALKLKDLTPEQRKVITTYANVRKKRGGSYKEQYRDLVSAFEMTGAEATHRNPSGGHLDSVGSRQERSHYGSAAKRLNIAGAAGRYFDEIAGVSRSKPAHQRAQAAQKSAFSDGSNYLRHRGDAISLARQVLGGGKGKKSAPAATMRGVAKPKKKGKAPTSTPVTTGDTVEGLQQQAQLASELRYGRERSGIAELLREAQGSLKANTALEEGVARGVSEATKAAQPRVAKGFAEASLASMQAKGLLDADFSKIGAGADPYRAASAREHSGSQRRLNELAHVANAELERRKVAAQEQRSFGLRKAQDTYESDRAKLGGRLQDISREEGAFIASTFGDALSKAKDRGVKSKIAKQNAKQRTADRQARERIAQLTQAGQSQRQAEAIASREQIAREAESGRNSRSALTAAGKKSKPKLTASQRNAAADQISEAQAWVGRLKGKMPTGQARQLLATGGTLEDKNGNKVKVPKISKTYVNTAFDLVYRGGVSSLNAKRLKARGVRVPSGKYRPLKPGKPVKRGAATGIGK